MWVYYRNDSLCAHGGQIYPESSLQSSELHHGAIRSVLCTMEWSCIWPLCWVQCQVREC
jgi:hypothetical protein